MSKYNPDYGKAKVRSDIISDAIKASRENSISQTMKENWKRKPYYMIVAAGKKEH